MCVRVYITIPVSGAELDTERDEGGGTKRKDEGRERMKRTKKEGKCTGDRENERAIGGWLNGYGWIISMLLSTKERVVRTTFAGAPLRWRV